MADAGGFAHLCGWLGVDDVQRGIAAQMPPLARAAPQLYGDRNDGKPILLYKAWSDVLGKCPDYPAQQIGDCVSFGHAHANDLLQCVQISTADKGEVYKETDTEFIYGESRKVAGMLGRGDGSYGSAAVKAMTTVGMVSREMLGSDGAYSGRRASSWGRTGPPSEWERKAGAYKLGASAQVSTYADLLAAIGSLYPVTICSNQGFTGTRDEQGFCAGRGRWGHCMFIAGVRFDRPGALICQSWGPETPGGPLALDQPSFSFWADQRVIERILGEGDSWAISKTASFERRAVPEHWTNAGWTG